MRDLYWHLIWTGVLHNLHHSSSTQRLRLIIYAESLLWSVNLATSCCFWQPSSTKVHSTLPQLSLVLHHPVERYLLSTPPPPLDHTEIYKTKDNSQKPGEFNKPIWLQNFYKVPPFAFFTTDWGPLCDVLSCYCPFDVLFAGLYIPQETASELPFRCFLHLFLPCVTYSVTFNSLLSPSIMNLFVYRDLFVMVTNHPSVCCVCLVACEMRNKASKTVLTSVPILKRYLPWSVGFLQ